MAEEYDLFHLSVFAVKEAFTYLLHFKSVRALSHISKPFTLALQTSLSLVWLQLRGNM